MKEEVRKGRRDLLVWGSAVPRPGGTLEIICGLKRGRESRGWGVGRRHIGLAVCSPDSVCYLGDTVPGRVCQLGDGCSLWPMWTTAAFCHPVLVPTHGSWGLL